MTGVFEALLSLIGSLLASGVCCQMCFPVCEGAVCSVQSVCSVEKEMFFWLDSLW